MEKKGVVQNRRCTAVKGRYVQDCTSITTEKVHRKKQTGIQGGREETEDIQLDKMSRNKEAMSLRRDLGVLRDWGCLVGGALVPT